MLSFTALSFFLVLWLFVPRRAFSDKTTSSDGQIQTTSFDSGLKIHAVNLHQYPSITDSSITAILPVDSESLSMLGRTLFPFLKPATNVQEIMIICPENLISQARNALRRTVSIEVDHPDISLHALVGGLDQELSVYNAASQVATDWVLFMDRQGLMQQDNLTIHTLLHPSGTSIPVGPRGVTISATNISCISASNGSEKASYLYPPFLMPSFLAADELPSNGLDLWANLGQRISNSDSESIGGIVTELRDRNMDWCPKPFFPKYMTPNAINPFGWDSLPLNISLLDPCLPAPLRPQANSGMFAFFLPTVHDLEHITPLACMLRRSGHRINMFVYHDPDGLGDATGWGGHTYVSGECSLSYSVLSGYSTFPASLQVHLVALDWLSTLDERPDIAVGPSNEDVITRVFTAKHEALRDAVFIRIPKEDFPYCGWMGSLSVVEWRGWLSHPSSLFLAHTPSSLEHPTHRYQHYYEG
jgi:hypothetical protein